MKMGNISELSGLQELMKIEKKNKETFSMLFLLGFTKEFNKLNFPINAIENLMSFLIYDFSRILPFEL